MKLLSFKNKFNLKSRIIHFYENWILPPQNESLIELKKREFREKTKYLKPEVFYALTEEEKKELRNEGYIVDLDKASLNKIRNFHLTYNRHQGRYQYYNNDYNQMVYQTKYYYGDQEENFFLGDEYFDRKMWKRRSPFKRYTSYFAILLCFVYLHSIYYEKKHIRLRNYHRKLYEENFDFSQFQEINTPLKIEVEGSFEEIYLKSLTEGYKASIIIRSDDEKSIRSILEVLNEFKTNLSDKNFKVCFLVLLSEEFYKSNAVKLMEKFNIEKYDQIRNISFFSYDYRKEDLTEKGFYHFMPDSLSIIDKNNKGYWGSKCYSDKVEVNKFQFKMKIGNLSSEEALKLSKANYLNI